MGWLILVSVVWAFSFSLVQELGAGAQLDANLLAFLRLSLALPLFLPFLRIKNLDTHERLQLAAIGALQYGAMYLLLFHAFAYLEDFKIALLTIFTPFYVTLLADALERKFRPLFLALAFLAVCGAAIVEYAEGDAWRALTGIAMMQASNLCFAFGQVAYRRFRKRRPALKDREIYALLYTGAVLVTFIPTAVSGSWIQIESLSVKQWCGVAYLGIVASGLAFFWWNK